VNAFEAKHSVWAVTSRSSAACSGGGCASRSRSVHASASGDSSRGMIDMGPSGVFAREIKPVDAIFDEILDEAVGACERLDRVRRSGRA
jgi:hypothetical protein